MKKILLTGFVGWLLSTALLLNPLYAAQAAAQRHTISVSPSVIALEKNAKLIIMGSGYRSGQEVLILFHDSLGVLTALPEGVVANDRGSWATVWDMGEYVSKKIIAGGVYPIMAADEKYNIFATTTAGFVDVTKEAKDWPDWAKASDIKKPEAQNKDQQKKDKPKKDKK